MTRDAISHLKHSRHHENLPMTKESLPVIDYEGSKYSTEFWTGAREYEDRAERIALRAMLPRRGGPPG